VKFVLVVQYIFLVYIECVFVWVGGGIVFALVCATLRNYAPVISLEKCFSNVCNFRPLFTLKLLL
jgi:hypothetical protein